MASAPGSGGPHVRLREVVDSDRTLFDTLSTPDQTGPWDTFESPDEMVRGRDYGGRTLVVELDGFGPVGSVSCIQVPYGPNRRSLAWRIGIVVLSGFRGQGVGTTAQRLFAQHLFDVSTANRVEADTDIDNVVEQRALERAGFSREGVIRAAQYRSGTWHDLVLFSRLRSDP